VRQALPEQLEEEAGDAKASVVRARRSASREKFLLREL
jgi:hypothetical protein